MTLIERILWNAPDTQVGADPDHFADVTVHNPLPHLDAHREVARPHGFHEKQLLLACDSIQFLCLPGVDGKCLLAQNGLVVLKAEASILVVVRMRRADVDCTMCGISACFSDNQQRKHKYAHVLLASDNWKSHAPRPILCLAESESEFPDNRRNTLS